MFILKSDKYDLWLLTDMFHFLRCIPRRINATFLFCVVVTLQSLIVMLHWQTNQHVQKRDPNNEVSPTSLKTEIVFHRLNSKYKRKERKKYLSYQPPGGGWNNQRIAFENAVIIAALLRRILLVQPLAPHDRMLDLIKQTNHPAGYTIYNMLTAKELVSISNIINLDRLSLLVSVQEITASHKDFLLKYNDSSWYVVCHNGLVQAWVDKIPFGFNTSSSNFEKYNENFKYLKKMSEIARYRKVCVNKTDLRFWEFLPELRKRKEDIIYFEKGSLFVRHLFFTDYKRALRAQKTVIDYIQPAQKVLRNSARIIQIIGKPFCAIHVRRNNHKIGQSMDTKYWISQLAEAKALQHSKRLYIATDETDYKWFSPFKDAGFSIFFAKDFQVFRKLNESHPITGKDIIGFHEQIICSQAKIFIESNYSSFSRIIERYRRARLWDRKHFHNFLFSSVRFLNVFR